MITVLTDGQVIDCGESIYRRILESAADTRYLTLDGADIKPCYACDGCKRKTFKRCVFRDDADRILPYIAQSNTLVIVTPLTFGGYSYQTKLIVDKLPLVEATYYYVNNKELVRGKDPSSGKLFVIGISDDCNEKEAKAFEFLIRETLLIANWRGKAIIARHGCDAKEIAKEVLMS